MSQQAPSAVPPSSGRSFAGMIGAMLVTVLVGGGWYLLGRPNEDPHPVTSQEYAPWVSSGRDDKKLAILAPPTVPKGWTVTSAKYDSGVDPRWRMGLLTTGGKFVGLAESPRPTDDLVSEYVDENASRGKDVRLAGVTWQTFTDSGGDYAVVRTLTAPAGGQERILVYGSAADAQIRSFAESLSATATPAPSATP